MQEQGFVKQGEKKDDQIQVAQGSYSYTSPEGFTVSVNYVADENGFQIFENESDMVGAKVTQSSFTTMRPTESPKNIGGNTTILQTIFESTRV